VRVARKLYNVTLVIFVSELVLGEFQMKPVPDEK
jgi:hypothetical protein